MNVITITDTKNNLVVKHQDMIRKARYSLSEMGIKVVSCLISMVHKDDKDFQEYHLSVSNFKELTGTASKDIYTQVHNTIKELLSKPFKIGDYQMNWCYLGHYKEGDGTVLLKIAPELKPYLLELGGNFTQYYLENILKLKSGYVIRLYELFVDLWNEHKRNHKSNLIFDLSIDDLRQKFEIPESYLYKDIRVNIIDKAQKQFKEKTDIQFTYEEQKIGRRIDRLIITIEENFKGSNDYMKSEQTFIAHMRKNYINEPILTVNSVKISISDKGNIYDRDTLKDFQKEEAYKYWKLLYSLAQKGDLLILKQGVLF